MSRTPLQPLPTSDQQQPQQQSDSSSSKMLDAMLNDEQIHYHKISLRGRKWRYRGEGNANLVIALPQGEIVRLHKAERGYTATLDEECSEQAEKIERERVWREVLFCRHVMVPLLGFCYLQPPAAARIDSCEVHQLSASLQSQRPAHRHHKDVLCSGGYATLYPDYALLPARLANSDPTVPTFCVEVKPKQGWIPPADRLSKCTYCMKQYLKLKNKSITKISDYCPLDLFSGDFRRMQTALRALLVSPQNNLKIFKNGNLIYGEDVGDYDKMFEMLQNWFGSSHKKVDDYRLVDKFCSVVLEALTRDLSDGKLTPFPAKQAFNCAFKNQFVQSSGYSPKRQAKSDAQSMYAKAASILQPGCDWNSQDLPADCILNRVLGVQKLEQSRKDWDLPTSPRAKKDYAYVGTVICDPGTLQSPLHRYLLAATAKDCSILLAFQPVDSERALSLPVCNIATESGGGQLFVFNVGVSDLDPKPVSCIEKHCKRNMEMLVAGIELTALKSDNSQ